MMGYSVSIRNNETGEVRDYRMWDDPEKNWQNEQDVFWWFEGNGNCDCNRSHFFENAAGNSEAEFDQCGHERFTITAIIMDNGDIVACALRNELVVRWDEYFG